MRWGSWIATLLLLPASLACDRNEAVPYSRPVRSARTLKLILDGCVATPSRSKSPVRSG